MEVSPPIQFRIEWAGSQGKSPLLGRWLIYLAVGWVRCRAEFRFSDYEPFTHFSGKRLGKLCFEFHQSVLILA